MTLPPVVLAAMPEAEWRRYVEGWLTQGGFLWFHAPDGAHNKRAQPGFPDLLAVHPRRGQVVVFELKTERGRVKPAQAAWLAALATAGVPAWVIRPRDYERVRAYLLDEKGGG